MSNFISWNLNKHQHFEASLQFLTSKCFLNQVYLCQLVRFISEVKLIKEFDIKNVNKPDDNSIPVGNLSITFSNYVSPRHNTIFLTFQRRSAWRRWRWWTGGRVAQRRRPSVTGWRSAVTPATGCGRRSSASARVSTAPQPAVTVRPASRGTPH